MTRIELWLTGSVVKLEERIGCCFRGCNSKSIKEFDCGFFCKKHFISAPKCCIKNCNNPAIVDSKYNSNGRCREHEFNYEPELKIYGHRSNPELHLKYRKKMEVR